MRKRKRPRLQEGGEVNIVDIVTQLLEQGETPEAIVETLVSNNIPQQEAVTTIQGVMQQMGMMQRGGQKYPEREFITQSFRSDWPSVSPLYPIPGVPNSGTAAPRAQAQQANIGAPLFQGSVPVENVVPQMFTNSGVPTMPIENVQETIGGAGTDPELAAIMQAMSAYENKNRGFKFNNTGFSGRAQGSNIALNTTAIPSTLDAIVNYSTGDLGAQNMVNYNPQVSAIPLNSGTVAVMGNSAPIGANYDILGNFATPYYSPDGSTREVRGAANSRTAASGSTSGTKGGYKGETPAEVWKKVTGMDWKEAKKLGYSDGSAKGNLALMRKLKKEGNFLVKPTEQTLGIQDLSYQLDLSPVAKKLNFQEGGGVTSQQQTQEEIIRYYQQGADRDTLINMLVQRGVDIQQATMYIDQIIAQLETFQEGGMAMGGDEEVQEMIQMIIEAFNEGYSEEEIVAQLVEAKGIPQETAVEIVMQISQSM